MLSKETIIEALKSVKYPGFSRDIVSFGLIRDAQVQDGHAQISLAITTSDAAVPAKLKTSVEEVIKAIDGITDVSVEIAVSRPNSAPGTQAAGAQQQQQSSEAMQEVKYIVAVASGKGGVGKSTFAVNLACAFDRVLSQNEDYQGVGIMDCDIYGPSIPIMLGVSGRPMIQEDSLLPMENFGIKTMSMGLLVDEETPVVWRGPMINKTIQQFAQNVKWGKLDLLVVDLPPGTGDAQLSLAQSIPLDGAIIVTTPQDVAVSVARRGAGMFEKVNVPLIGVAENMSYMRDANGDPQYIFGEGGGQKAAEALNTSMLGQIPLDANIRVGGDMGVPIVLGVPDSEAAKNFQEIAKAILEKLAK